MTEHRARPPWWLVAGGASFVLYFALLVYCEVRRPVEPGLEIDFDHRTIDEVVPGSPAERAGIKPGDANLEVDGRLAGSLVAWRITLANLRVGEPIPVRVERNGTPLDFPLILTWAPLSALKDRLTLWIARGVQLITLCLAFAVAFKRPNDLAARICAAFLAGIGVFSIVLPYRFADVWRALPVPLGAMLWLPFFVGFAAEALLFVFCAVFPKGNRWPRVTWVAVLAPAAATLIWHGWFGVVTVYGPRYAQTVPRWSEAVTVTNAAYAVAGAVLLLLKYGSMEDVNERRRTRVLILGSLIGLAAGLPVIVMQWLGVHVSRNDAFTSFSVSPGTAIGTLMLLALPISFAYATVRHRMFDVSVMLRLGLRYTLARRLLLSAVPVLSAAIAIDAWQHRREALGDILRAHAVAYSVVVGLIAAASFRRHTWLDSLDRHFFRERYNAQQVLRRLADEVRESADLSRVAPMVVQQIESALHPEFVQILVRRPGEADYRVVAAAPEGTPPHPISATSKLLGILRILERPIEVPQNETGWFRQLPPEEQQSLRSSRVDLLVPITLSPNRDEAMLVLGARRSEEPYSAEDHDLLGAIAGSLALTIAESMLLLPTTGSFDECPDCGLCYDSGTGTCTKEGARLATVPAPRLLASRYRIVRRLGRGGMGTVYAAVDLSLEREVAAKLVRDELMEDPAAGERFRREARVAAGFTHPQVVTIHDFGITPEGRAFLIMELVQGPTLRRELERCGRLPPARVRAILRGICAAVDAAHGRRLVHRDLKPENVMLTAEGVDSVKVVDFGVAKALPAASTNIGWNSASGLVGTLQYMAPEQLRCEDVSASWDLWAIAIMTHEMLTGVHPYSARASAELAIAGTGSYQDAAGTYPADKGWGPFFERALALDARMRPQTAGLLLADFERGWREP